MRFPKTSSHVFRRLPSHFVAYSQPSPPAIWQSSPLLLQPLGQLMVEPSHLVNVLPLQVGLQVSSLQAVLASLQPLGHGLFLAFVPSQTICMSFSQPGVHNSTEPPSLQSEPSSLHPFWHFFVAT